MRLALIGLLLFVAFLNAQNTAVGWRCWYNEVRDGGHNTTQVFTSTDYDWADLPKIGWQVMILYYDNGYRRIISGSDFYWRCSKSADGYCQGQTRPNRISAVEIKEGLTISNEEFNRIHAEAWASHTAPSE